MNQNPFSAEDHKLGYGRVEITTKPGLEKYHGQVFVNGNTSSFNTRNPFATQEPSYHSQFYNGNVGGPLGKKASFFFNLFRRDINDVNVVSAYVLSPDLTQQVPFSQAVPNNRMRLNLGPRVDFQLSSKNVLTVRYQAKEDKEYENGPGQFSLASQEYNEIDTEHNIQVSDTHVSSEKVVNQARFRWAHEPDNITPQSLLPTLSVQGAFTGGGSSRGKDLDTQDCFEFQNYTLDHRGQELHPRRRTPARLRRVKYLV